jgi:hypothetical protein
MKHDDEDYKSFIIVSVIVICKKSSCFEFVFRVACKKAFMRSRQSKFHRLDLRQDESLGDRLG